MAKIAFKVRRDQIIIESSDFTTPATLKAPFAPLNESEEEALPWLVLDKEQEIIAYCVSEEAAVLLATALNRWCERNIGVQENVLTEEIERRYGDKP